MKTMHTFITANYDNYIRCVNTSAKFDMECHYENKPTCIKKHHITVIARTPEQGEILNLLILACTAHAEQDTYKKKLAERIKNA